MKNEKYNLNPQYSVKGDVFCDACCVHNIKRESMMLGFVKCIESIE